MIAPGIAFCHVFTPAAFAFFIHAFAFPLQLTDLFWATYQVQFPHANQRESPVYFTKYLDFSQVLLSITVGLVLGIGVGIGVRFVPLEEGLSFVFAREF